MPINNDVLNTTRYQRTTTWDTTTTTNLYARAADQMVWIDLDGNPVPPPTQPTTPLHRLKARSRGLPR
jgi:hypothetical protein